MSLFKRHIGRRVAGVGVGVALLVLGLEAPAFAVLGLTSFTPASGPIGCVIVLTGTDFQGPDVSSVKVGGVTAEFEIQSDTEIWVEAPDADTTAGGPAASGFITVDKAATGESVSSATAFTGTTAPAAGTCAPTITSFAPTCGPVGTTVTITGTNLIQPGTTVNTFVGGFVDFSPFVATVGIRATHTGAAETPTSLTVLVPTGAKTGPISVQTAVSEVFSTADFTVPVAPATCVPTGGPTHGRSITLSLRKHLVARGRVSSTEDPAFTDCVASVPVKIQRRRAGGWRTVGSTTTTDTGAYKKRIKDRPGRYRALAPKVTLEAGDVCLRAVSPRRTHRH